MLLCTRLGLLRSRPETLEIFSLVFPPLPWTRRHRANENMRRVGGPRAQDEGGIVIRDLHGVDAMVLRASPKV